MNTRITIELYTDDGSIWRYDSYQDGPIGQWLANVGSKLNVQLNKLSHNATIHVWPEAG